MIHIRFRTDPDRDKIEIDLEDGDARANILNTTSHDARVIAEQLIAQADHIDQRKAAR